MRDITFLSLILLSYITVVSAVYSHSIWPWNWFSSGTTTTSTTDTNDVHDITAETGGIDLFNLDKDCQRAIIAKIRDPYHLANFMASCQEASDLIDNIGDENVVRRATGDSLLTRYQPVRISTNLANFLKSRNEESELFGSDLFLITLPSLQKSYRFEIIVEGMRNIVNELGQTEFGSCFNAVMTSYIAHHPEIMEETPVSLCYGRGYSRSYIIYSSLQRFDPSPSLCVYEPVLVEDELIRDTSLNGWGGYISSHIYRITPWFHFTHGRIGSLSVTAFIDAVIETLEITRTYLERINVRYSRYYIGSDEPMLCSRFNGDCHLFLHSKSCSAFDETVPNENALVIISYFSQTLYRTKVDFIYHRQVQMIRDVFCRFSEARAFVNMISTSGSHVYKCKRTTDLVPDTISISDAVEMLKSIKVA